MSAQHSQQLKDLGSEFRKKRESLVELPKRVLAFLVYKPRKARDVWSTNELDGICKELMMLGEGAPLYLRNAKGLSRSRMDRIEKGFVGGDVGLHASIAYAWLLGFDKFLGIFDFEEEGSVPPSEPDQGVFLVLPDKPKRALSKELTSEQWELIVDTFKKASKVNEENTETVESLGTRAITYFSARWRKSLVFKIAMVILLLAGLAAASFLVYRVYRSVNPVKKSGSIQGREANQRYARQALPSSIGKLLHERSPLIRTSARRRSTGDNFCYRVKSLITIIRDADKFSNEVSSAFDDLVMLDCPSAIPHLLEFLQHNDRIIRMQTVRASGILIASTKSYQYARRLLGAFKDDDVFVRAVLGVIIRKDIRLQKISIAFFVKLVNKTRPRRLTSELGYKIQSSNPPLLAKAIHVLGCVRTKRAIRELEKFYKSRPMWVKFSVMQHAFSTQIGSDTIMMREAILLFFRRVIMRRNPFFAKHAAMKLIPYMPVRNRTFNTKLGRLAFSILRKTQIKQKNQKHRGYKVIRDYGAESLRALQKAKRRMRNE